jgi:putative transposase
VERIIDLACQYGRYGYRRITALLRNEGWKVNHKRVERIWRQEGLKVPKKQPKRGRLWLTDGSCIRLRPERKNHVWSYDLAMIRTTDGRAVRILVIIDEYTRECLFLFAARKVKSQDVLDQLYELFISRGIPDYIRSDNGPEFTAQAVRDWLELLNGEIFDTLLEARVVIESWRREYNQFRPHSSLGYRPPAPEAYELRTLTLDVYQ